MEKNPEAMEEQKQYNKTHPEPDPLQPAMKNMYKGLSQNISCCKNNKCPECTIQGLVKNKPYKGKLCKTNTHGSYYTHPIEILEDENGCFGMLQYNPVDLLKMGSESPESWQNISDAECPANKEPEYMTRPCTKGGTHPDSYGI